MPNFTIEDDGTGKFVLIDSDSGQRTTYATRREAEEAKTHLSSQAGGQRSGQRPNPDQDQGGNR